MDSLMRIKDVVVGYISPASKRRRTVGPGISSQDAEDHLLMTPSSEPVKKWREAAIVNLSYQSWKSISDNKGSKKRTRDDFEDEGKEGENALENQDNSTRHGRGLGGSPSEAELSLMAEDAQILDARDENSQISDTSLVLKEDSIDDNTGEEDEIDLMTSERFEADEKVQEYLDRQAELALRQEDVAKAKASGDWHPDEIFLFERLSLRSFEAVLPKSWKMDFPTLPHAIFAEDDITDTFVNSAGGSSSHGIKALQALLSLGVRVRDNVLTGASTEKLIAREIQSYIKWAEKDGGYSRRRYLPVLTVVAARPKQTIDSLSATINDQMKFLAEKYRETLAIPGALGGRVNGLDEIEIYTSQPPLLYGMIVARTIVIFVTLDSAKPDASLRHMQHFDFKESNGSDVWIGFAIAMMVIVARNYIISIKNELEIDNEQDIDADI